MGGEPIKLRVTLHLRSASGNDVDAVDIRATDRDETGSFRNLGVDLRRISMRVKNANADVVARVTTPSSPFAVDLGDASDNVGKVHTEARFRAHQHVTVIGCNFTFTSTPTSGNG